MEFSFMSTIHVDDTCIDAMVRRFIKAKRNVDELDDIITDIMSGMDDEIWYHLEDIYDELKDEVIGRANKIKKIYLTK